MIYDINKEKRLFKHAGAKAPGDIDSLCEKRGWVRLEYPNYCKDNSVAFFRAMRSVRILLFWLKLLFVFKKGDIALYQHPMRCGAPIANKFIKRLQRKGVSFIGLIHDIDSLRYKSTDKHVIFEDAALLKAFDLIICHNPHMRDYLINKGYAENKIICLNLFDYLVAEDKVCATDSLSIVVAGNLQKKKSGYIYKLAPLCSTLVFYVYGVNFEGDNGSLSYQGSEPPDSLPCCLKGYYGLVWDGNSIDSCEGELGEYLKYNNPHKLSLYIASGKPVICWSKAAIADFVKDNKIGIVVDSLKELPNLLNTIDELSYLKMKKNVLAIREKVISGYFFYTAIDEAILRLNEYNK